MSPAVAPVKQPAFAWPAGARGALNLTFDSNAQIEAICAYCREPANGIWLDTVAAIGAHVRRARGF